MGKTKQPHCFEVNGGELFAFAGLWETWKDPGGKILETCSILTTTPNAVASAIHDLMPVYREGPIRRYFARRTERLARRGIGQAGFMWPAALAKALALRK
jgi:hypothetical protein